ncbi:uncharacterized protein E0L32_009424 [Thyridium curvatum]|uniref:Uncharacterized protein n=1 Tax=Thyridium curvatum TaxID=1093900 RepID=A0A507AYR1_9PEZI|nr:uncharacterized protein E0L32_009424 [Thyridium curvatum]TPX09380.1 hypothetical protein E0L32_009424 [Thyridium curvatum]
MAEYFEKVGGEKTVLMAYLEETLQLVKDIFQPVNAICFDWRFRRRDPTVSGRIPPRALEDIRSFALPTGDVVHCDYSASGGLDRLKVQLLENELQEFRLRKQKAMIINVWRPLNDSVKNTPLLFCDRRSVPKKDLIEVHKVRSDKVEKSYFLFHRDYHRWYYLSGQRKEEVAIFPTWQSDSRDDFAGKRLFATAIIWYFSVESL